MQIEIQPVEGEEDRGLWLQLRNAVAAEELPADQRDRLRELAPDTVELLALLDGRPVAAAFVGTSISEPLARQAGVGAHVLREWRSRGVGSALYGELSRRARVLGKDELEATGPASDDTSLAFLRRRGFREVTRSQQATLELAGLPEREPPAPPEGLEVVVLEGRPELAAGMYEVAREAIPDIPVAERLETGTEEEWRRLELDQARADLTVVALAEGSVVGYSTLGDFGEGVGLHLMTGVRRDRRGQGIARALKLAQIDASRRAGLIRLLAFNDATNAPMQRLNVALGYRLHPVYVTLRGPLAPAARSAATPASN